MNFVVTGTLRLLSFVTIRCWLFIFIAPLATWSNVALTLLDGDNVIL